MKKLFSYQNYAPQMWFRKVKIVNVIHLLFQILFFPFSHFPFYAVHCNFVFIHWENGKPAFELKHDQYRYQSIKQPEKSLVNKKNYHSHLWFVNISLGFVNTKQYYLSFYSLSSQKNWREREKNWNHFNEVNVLFY